MVFRNTGNGDRIRSGNHCRRRIKAVAVYSSQFSIATLNSIDGKRQRRTGEAHVVFQLHLLTDSDGAAVCRDGGKKSWIGDLY